MVEVVLPNDANPLGNILGGKVMHLMDMAGAIAAHRHSRSAVVTAAMDQLEFLHPIKIGDLIISHAQVTATFNTSMEVEVKVYSENVLTGIRRPTSAAFITFVALDRNSVPTRVPPLNPETDEENEKMQQAHERRRLRLSAKNVAPSF